MKELFRITVSEIAAGSGEALPASDTVLTCASTLANPRDHSIVFVKDTRLLERFDLTGVRDALLLVPEQGRDLVPEALSMRNVVASVPNPRLSFARLMTFAASSLPLRRDYQLRGDALIERTAETPGDLYVEPGALVDHSVTIGVGVRILAGAIIRPYTVIGDGTTVCERAVVGCAGFGFERDQSGIAVRIPHLGGVAIGAGVEIGSLTNVCAGTIDPTVVDDGVKIDGLCHIAHNCHIGTGSIVTGSTTLSGSVYVGEYSWLGPNSTILEGRRLGQRVTVGIGAVVLNDVDDGDVVAGNPARSIRSIARSRAWHSNG